MDVRFVALVVGFVVGCGSASSGPADGGTDGAARVASNGVPIPDVDPTDSCAGFGIEASSCADGSDVVTCDCSGTARTFSGDFMGRCLAHLSCTAACARPDRAEVEVFRCLWEGLCQSGSDCKAGSRCVVAPGYTTGQCTSGQLGATCYADADCSPTSCVATIDGEWQCSDGRSGSPCNRNEQCADEKCLLGPSAYAGVCTNGARDNPCLVDPDCRPGRCVEGVCGDGTSGALCKSGDDCFGNPCVKERCQTGEDGALCSGANDCHSSICDNSKCSSGVVGHACRTNEHCLSHKCSASNGSEGTCTEGQVGQACALDLLQCEAGLHCDGNQGICVSNGTVGASCVLDTDCQSGKCGGKIPAQSRCTEGKLGQRCRDSQQCDPGLRCVAYPFGGLCLAGAAGDPCWVNGDCASDTCSGDADAGLFAVGQCPVDLAPCGPNGQCVAGICFTQRCAPTDGGAPPDAP